MPAKVKAVLFDIEGTIYANGVWIDGAIDTIQWLLENGIAVRFVTNKTTASQETIWQLFNDTALDIPREWVYTPAFSAKRWFLKTPVKNGILPLVHSSVLVDLDGLDLTQSENADFVLLGNMGEEWQIDLLNKALRAVLNGATLTTLEMNKSWVANDGHRLLAGPFVKALEYAAGSACEVVFGKPSSVLFNTILADVNVDAAEALIAGDDLDADILGAVQLGMRGFLVKTGRYSGGAANLNGRIEVAESVASLRAYLEGA